MQFVVSIARWFVVKYGEWEGRRCINVDVGKVLQGCMNYNHSFVYDNVEYISKYGDRCISIMNQICLTRSKVAVSVLISITAEILQGNDCFHHQILYTLFNATVLQYAIQFFVLFSSLCVRCFNLYLLMDKELFCHFVHLNTRRNSIHII